MANLSERIISFLEPSIGKEKASKAVIAQCKKMGIKPEQLSSENVDPFLKNLVPSLKIFAGDEFSEKIMEKIKTAISTDVESELNAFLVKNPIPTESDIAKYVKHLTVKYSIDAKKVEKDIIGGVRETISTAVIKNRIKQEINNFLTRIQQPTPNDINDFIVYLQLSSLKFQEKELKDNIEKERLYQKFHGPRETTSITEIDKFIEFIKDNPDKDTLSSTLKSLDLAYLIRDDAGVFDKSLIDLIQQIIHK